MYEKKEEHFNKMGFACFVMIITVVVMLVVFFTYDFVSHSVAKQNIIIEQLQQENGRLQEKYAKLQDDNAQLEQLNQTLLASHKELEQQTQLLGAKVDLIENIDDGNVLSLKSDFIYDSQIPETLEVKLNRPKQEMEFIATRDEYSIRFTYHNVPFVVIDKILAIYMNMPEGDRQILIQTLFETEELYNNAMSENKALVEYIASSYNGVLNNTWDREDAKYIDTKGIDALYEEYCK